MTRVTSSGNPPASDDAPRGGTAVVGGGLAGATAALALADAGVRVTLLEGRPARAGSSSPSSARAT
ncbi:hypothetical protein SHIRM173S_12418 [Streptomyces hirsutus]